MQKINEFLGSNDKSNLPFQVSSAAGIAFVFNDGKTTTYTTSNGRVFKTRSEKGKQINIAGSKYEITDDRGTLKTITDGHPSGITELSPKQTETFNQEVKAKVATWISSAEIHLHNNLTNVDFT